MEPETAWLKYDRDMLAEVDPDNRWKWRPVDLGYEELKGWQCTIETTDPDLQFSFVLFRNFAIDNSGNTWDIAPQRPTPEAFAEHFELATVTFTEGGSLVAFDPPVTAPTVVEVREHILSLVDRALRSAVR
ncbi:hypothetical protein [Nocardia salmonicida]|uniref:DUF317 domain-containing protein n=1 Tax=Nocardia salmonicida TaxID=53431 RepID=A0ABZ1N7E6_9NOCA|nr:hypothetical protein [Nocardia salmonicida]